MNKRALMLCLATSLLVGCTTGPMQIRLTAPRVELDSVRIGSGNTELELRVHNRNDHEVVIERLDIELLDSNGHKITSGGWPLALDIGPSNRDRIIRRTTLSQAGRTVFDRLGDDAQRTAELRMKIEIKVRGQRAERTVETVHIHPVPGQPGQFRGAGGRTEHSSRRE